MQHAAALPACSSSSWPESGNVRFSIQSSDNSSGCEVTSSDCQLPWECRVVTTVSGHQAPCHLAPYSGKEILLVTVEGSAPVVWNILIDSIISLLSDCRPNWLSAVSLLPPTPNVDISPSLTTSHRPLLTISRPFHPSSSRPRPAAHQHQGTGYKVRPGEGRVQSESDARKVQTFCSSLRASDHNMGMVEIPVQRLSEEEQQILRQEAEIERIRQRRWTAWKNNREMTCEISFMIPIFNLNNAMQF